MEGLRNMHLIPRVLSASAIIGLATLTVKLYGAPKNSITINCLPTSGEYQKNSPKAKELTQKGFNMKENPNGTVSFWLLQVNPEEICGQENVEGISTSGNPKIMEKIQGALEGNLDDKQKKDKRLDKAGKMIEDAKANAEKEKKKAEELKKELDAKNTRLNALEKQIPFSKGLPAKPSETKKK